MTKLRLAGGNFGYDTYTSALSQRNTGVNRRLDYNNRGMMTWRRQQLNRPAAELRREMKRSHSGSSGQAFAPGPSLLL